MSATLIPTSKRGIRILLVEDNPANRQLMTDYLKYCGYDVLSLSLGTTFSLAMRQYHPHLVLLDLKLPDIDGFTLLQHMRRTPGWQHIPVIVVSAYAFQADRQRALSLGANRYLIKPVKLTELMQAIAEEVNNLPVTVD